MGGTYANPESLDLFLGGSGRCLFDVCAHGRAVQLILFEGDLSTGGAERARIWI